MLAGVPIQIHSPVAQGTEICHFKQRKIYIFLIHSACPQEAPIFTEKITYDKGLTVESLLQCFQLWQIPSCSAPKIDAMHFFHGGDLTSKNWALPGILEIVQAVTS